jgi:hypothetical protein
MAISARLRHLSHLPLTWAVSLPKSLLRFLVEVILIGIAVFLGLVANQWREDRQHRELATVTLRYFRQDATVNRQALRAEREYHESLARQLGVFLNSDLPKTAQNFEAKVHFMGVRPIIFEHTAWDLALATQSLSYLKPQLAYALSRVYTRQQALQTLEDTFLQATYAIQDPRAQATALEVYMTDVNIQEPVLLKLLDELIPELDQNQSQ